MCAGGEVTPGNYFQAFSYFFNCFFIHPFVLPAFQFYTHGSAQENKNAKQTSSKYPSLSIRKRKTSSSVIFDNHAHSRRGGRSGLESGSIPFCRPSKRVNFIHEFVKLYIFSSFLFFFICFTSKETLRNKVF